ncbi:hypothetical protein [Rosenbergiella nectarea]|nr:hypothetical protein [Rosenbergiella nectarea]
MALSDVKVRSAKPEEKAYKLTGVEGIVLLVHPNICFWMYLVVM